MFHILKSAAARTATHILTSVLALALLLTVLRLALPFADVFRSEVEGLLEERLGLEVRVGHFGLRLAGWVPRLTLEDLVLSDLRSGRRQLDLDALILDLDLGASVRRLSPRVESLTLVGAHLVVKRRADGSIALVGLEGMKTADPQIMRFFLTNGRFLLTESDILWVDEYANASPVHLSNVRLKFENAASRHRIGMLARLFEDPQTEIHLAGDLKGAPELPHEWSGDLYVRTHGRDLHPLLYSRLPPGLHVGSDKVMIESWSRIAGSAPAESFTNLSVEGLVVWREVAGGSPAPLRLDELGAQVRWEREDRGWALKVSDLTLERSGVKQAPMELSLRFAGQGKGGWSLAGGVSGFDLSHLVSAQDLVPKLPAAAFSLKDAGLEGRLEDIRFRFERHPDDTPSWVASGGVSDLATAAHENWPGIRGLDLHFSVSENGGRLAVSSDGLSLSQPETFSMPVRFDRLAGTLFWYRDELGRLQVEVPDFAAENTDFCTRSRLALMLPADGRPFLDIYTRFEGVDASAVRRYLPTGRMKPKLAKWLDRAFVSGWLPWGTVLFRGAPGDFPFDGETGRFEVLFGAQDVVLDFHPDWPRIEEIVAEARFENREMEVHAASARLLDSEILSTEVRIPNLLAATGVEIRGKAEGPFTDGLRMLTETPLAKRLEPIGRAFQVDGLFQVDIQALTVPLRYKGELGPLRLKGEITWPDQASITLSRWDDLQLEGLGGALAFTETSVSAESIEANLWGHPVRLAIETRGKDASDRSTRVDASGKLPAEVLARHFPSPLWGLVKGRSQLDLTVDLRNAGMGEPGKPLTYSLGSQLTGISVDLPEPLGKSGSASRTLHLEGTLVPGGDLDATGSYGDTGLDLLLARDRAGRLGFARGNVTLGGKAAKARGEGLRVEGKVAALDVSTWMDWWEGLRASESGQGGDATLQAVDIKAGRLNLGGLSFEDIGLRLERDAQRWLVRVDAPGVAGDIGIPQGRRDAPVRVQLERLDLEPLLAGFDDSARSSTAGKRSSDPRQVRTLELRVDRLLWADNLLGSVRVDSRRVPAGIELSPLRLSGELMSIDGTASWTADKWGQRTQIDLTGEGGDLGEILRRLQYESVIHEAPVTAKVSLGWYGGPSEVSAEALDGQVEIDVSKGSLLEVEPGVGRMLGILNLAALQRRLSLDFSDLFGKGYSFESMTGKLAIAKGKATIEKLEIEGPSAGIEITGSTDLVAQTFDQVVTVIPRIGTGVALAGALAGGPLVGAAVYIADKVTGGAVEKLGSYQYEIRGPWMDPEIRHRGSWTRGSGQTASPENGRAGAQQRREEKPSGLSEKGSGEVTRDNPGDQQDKPSETNPFLIGY